MEQYTVPDPIKSQEEADSVRNYLATTTANTLGIPLEEAYKRVEGLLKSGVLEGGNPADPVTQRKIESFLLIPSETYSHLK